MEGALVSHNQESKELQMNLKANLKIKMFKKFLPTILLELSDVKTLLGTLILNIFFLLDIYIQQNDNVYFISLADASSDKLGIDPQKKLYYNYYINNYITEQCKKYKFAIN